VAADTTTRVSAATPGARGMLASAPARIRSMLKFARHLSGSSAGASARLDTASAATTSRAPRDDGGSRRRVEGQRERRRRADADEDEVAIARAAAATGRSASAAPSSQRRDDGSGASRGHATRATASRSAAAAAATTSLAAGG
jgi:hypothetical protein